MPPQTGSESDGMQAVELRPKSVPRKFEIARGTRTQSRPEPYPSNMATIEQPKERTPELNHIRPPSGPLDRQGPSLAKRQLSLALPQPKRTSGLCAPTPPEQAEGRPDPAVPT